MENIIEIIITQLKKPKKITIEGKITSFVKKEKSYFYLFDITNLTPNNVVIPASCNSVEEGTNTIIVNKKENRKLKFWRIKQVNDTDTSFKIISYANILEYFKDE